MAFFQGQIQTVKSSLGRTKYELLLADFAKAETIKDWICDSDAQIGGFSKAFWSALPDGGARFSGHISRERPAANRQSGYALCRNKLSWKFFVFNKKTINLNPFDDFVFRIRGDGRVYHLNVRTRFVDVNPQEVWIADLHTTKSDEWKNVVVPFRDFYQTNKGRILLRQPNKVLWHDVISVGFSIRDREGPFQLDIQSIKATTDVNPIQNELDGIWFWK
eukprot:Pompholyxophrys_punicea_v1_NODE_1156_length_904_cov_4.409894.p1 type:complete len:219 gc:universal NODE_1156_length_904_cov_4.409894:93-749(+)